MNINSFGFFRRISCIVTLMAFLVNSVGVAGQPLPFPPAGERISLSPSFQPTVLKGIEVEGSSPLNFKFILATGDSENEEADLKTESTRLIKYFLASVTVPEQDLWVNLSPFEKDRIIAAGFGETALGRDLLSQDYLLKQITASVIYPESETGREFWDRVYKAAYAKYGTTDVPVDTFNKVWIVPDTATVSERGRAAYVMTARLKVLLETDYLAERAAAGGHPSTEVDGDAADRRAAADLSKQLLRDIVIPILEQEVNEGANFATLRQVYYSLILGKWYKNKIRESILARTFADRNKVAGLKTPAEGSPRPPEEIWQRYVEAFRKGVYNYVKEEMDPNTREVIPRKYFSGGCSFVDLAMNVTQDDFGDTEDLQTNGKLYVVSGHYQAALPEEEVKADAAQEPEAGTEYLRARTDVQQRLTAAYETAASQRKAVTIDWPLAWFSGKINLDEFILPGGKVVSMNKLMEDYQEMGVPFDKLNAMGHARNVLALSSFDALKATVVYLGDNKYQIAFIGYQKRGNGRLTRIDMSDIWVVTDEVIMFQGRSSFNTAVRQFMGNPTFGKEIDISEFDGVDLADGTVSNIPLPNGRLWKGGDLGFEEPSLSKVTYTAVKENGEVYLVFKGKRLTADNREEDIGFDSVWKIDVDPHDPSAPVRAEFSFDTTARYEERLRSLYDGKARQIILTLYEYLGSDWNLQLKEGFILPDGSRLEKPIVFASADDLPVSGHTIVAKDGKVQSHRPIRLTARQEGGRLILNARFKGRTHTMDAEFIWDGRTLTLKDLVTTKERQVMHAYNVKEGETVTVTFPSNETGVDPQTGTLPAGFPMPDGSRAAGPVLLVDGSLAGARELTAAYTRRDGILVVRYTLAPKGGGRAEEELIQVRKRWEGRQWVDDAAPRNAEIEARLLAAYQVAEGERRVVDVAGYEMIKVLGTLVGFLSGFLLPDGHRLVTPKRITHDRGTVTTLEITREKGQLYFDVVSYEKKDGDTLVRLWSYRRFKIMGSDLVDQGYVDDSPRGREDTRFREFYSSRESNFWTDQGALFVDTDGVLELPTTAYVKGAHTRKIPLKARGDVGSVQVEIERKQGSAQWQDEFFYVIITRGKAGDLRSVIRLHWDGTSLNRTGFVDGVEEERKEREGRAERDRVRVDEEIGQLLDDIPTESMLAFAARYSLDLKNIIWGLVGAKLEGQYDEKALMALIDERMFAFLQKTADEQDSEVELSDGKGIGAGKGIQWLEVDINEDHIRRIADYVESRLPAQGPALDTWGRRTREWSVNFIRKLEEKYFFKEFYSDAPGNDVLTKARAAVETARQKAQEGSVYRAALQAVIEEVETALTLQDQLKASGLHPDTNLNLYQLIGVMRMHKLQRSILGDEMGLGKTLESIATFLVSGEDEMLVLAPNEVVGRWTEDIARHTETPVEVVFLSSNAPVGYFEGLPHVTVKADFKNGRDRYDYLLKRPPTNGRRRIIIANHEILPFFQAHRKKLAVEAHQGRDGEPELPEVSVPFLVIDEAHLLKSAKAKRTQAVFGDPKTGAGAFKAKYKIVATGTPLENEVTDIFGYLKYLALDGNTPQEEFVRSLDVSTFKDIYRPENLAKIWMLHGYLSERMVRRLTDEVIKGLPEKRIHIVTLDPFQMTMRIDGGEPVKLEGDYRVQLEMIRQVLDEPQAFEARYGAFETGDDQNETAPASASRATQILRLEQVSLGSSVFGVNADSIKFKALERLIEEVVGRQNRSTLVFSTFKSATTLGKAAAERSTAQYSEDDARRKVAYLDGDVVREERTPEIDDFQEERARTMLATIGVAGVGLNLTQAEAQIHLNWPWKPSTFDQAVGRSRRIDAKRNRPGKVLDVYVLEVHAGVSIDAVKRKIIRLKHMLSEMLINGNLSPEILQALYELDARAIEFVKQEAEPSPEKMDMYEMSILQKFQSLLAEVLKEKDPERAERLWAEISVLYAKIILHKGSFFANVANLDQIANAERFPELQGSAEKPKRALDVGSGPSTLKRAYLFDRQRFQENGLFLDIVDLDASRDMLLRGLPGPGQQLLGSMDDLDQMSDRQWDWVNLSFAFRFAHEPAKLLQNVHRILRPNGVFSMILPSKNILDQQFIDAVKALGFEVKTGPSDMLVSKIDSETYASLVAEYGAEVAGQLAQQSQGRFTYLVARKDREPDASVSLDELNARLHVKINLPRFGFETVEAIQKSPGRLMIVPNGGHVVGEVVSRPRQDAAWERHVRVDLNPQLRALESLERALNILEMFLRKGVGRQKFRTQVSVKPEVFENFLQHDLGRFETQALRKLGSRIREVTEIPHVKDWLNDPGNAQYADALRDIKGRIENAVNGSPAIDEAMGGGRADYGGIDFTAEWMEAALKTEDRGTVALTIDEIMLKRFETAPGIVPVVTSVTQVNRK